MAFGIFTTIRKQAAVGCQTKDNDAGETRKTSGKKRGHVDQDQGRNHTGTKTKAGDRVTYHETPVVVVFLILKVQ